MTKKISKKTMNENLRKVTSKIDGKVKIDLGCGKWKKEGYAGFDMAPLPNVDVVCDLNKGIPLPDKSVDRVYTTHFLEHVDNPLFLIEEIWRVLKVEGIVEIKVPHWSNWLAYNPTHRSFWASNSFDIFDPKSKFFFYSKASFNILSLKLVYGDLGGRFFFTRMARNIFQKILNINHIWSEKFIVKYISAYEMHVFLRKVIA